MELNKNGFIGRFLYMSITGMLILNCLPPLDIAYGETLRQWKFFYFTTLPLGLIVVTLAMTNDTLQKKRFHESILLAFSTTGGIEALWGIFQLLSIFPSYSNTYKLTGSFFNPGPYACYLSMCLPACMDIGKSYSKYIVSLNRISILLILLILPATMSRTGWSSAIISVSCYFLISKSTSFDSLIIKHKARYFMLGCIGMMHIFLLGYFTFYSIKNQSMQGRFYLWEIEIRAIADKPSGYGKGKFQIAFANAQEKYMKTHKKISQPQITIPHHAFNEYFYVTIEHGIVVTVAALSCTLLYLILFYKKKNIGFFCILLSLAISCFASYPLYFPLFIMSLLLILCCPIVEYLSLRSLVSHVASSLVLCFIFIISYIGGQTKIQQESACMAWDEKRILYGLGMYQKAKLYYEQLYEKMKWNDMFLFEYGRILSLCKNYRTSNTIMKELCVRNGDIAPLLIIADNYAKIGQYKMCEFYLRMAINRLPDRIYPYYKLAKLYSNPNFKNTNKLKKTLHDVQKIQINILSPATKQMLQELETLK